MKKSITIGQVKEIAFEISKSYEIQNHGSYYNVIDKKTRKCSIEGGDKNFVSYNMYQKIRNMYLSFIGENALYFDWMMNGVEASNERVNYTFKIKQKVVELLSGYKY